VSGVRGVNGELQARLVKMEADLAAAHARIAELEAENRDLRRLLEDERRKGKRQASPFAKALKKDPKKPGRKRGAKYGIHARRSIPKKIDRRETVQCPMWCSDCHGRELKQVERMAFQHQSHTILTEGDPVAVYAQYSYNSNGRVKRSWNRTNGEILYFYDDATRTSSVVQPPNAILGVARSTSYAFDALGRTVSVTDPLGNVTSYEYDALDRITKVTLPRPSATSTLNFITRFSYDNAGANPALTYVLVTDPNNRVTRQGYDAFARLAESTDAGGHTTVYGYTHGLLASIADANGNGTSYDYDAFRRLSRTTFPDGKSESYEYFTDGKLSAKTDRKGVRTTYSYDAYGRMVLQTTGAQSRAFTFEGQKLTILSDTYGGTTDTIMYTYDPKSFLPLSERQGVGVGTVRGTVDYTWGTSTDLMASYKITDPEVPPNDTQTITYGYFADNSVASIHWSRGPGSYRYTYDGNGQPITISFPNGQTRNFTYDDQGRLTKIRNLLGTTNLATFDYEYDKDNDTGLFTVLGQRTKVTATVPALSPIATKTELFYDASSQLTRTRTTTTSATEQSWTYDAIGNRLTQTAGGTTTTYSYVKNGTNPNNSARLATAGANALSHDVNGNMTAFGAITYAWDVLDRLKTRTGGGLTSTFSYDAQGRRTRIDHESTKFIYQGLNAVDMSYKKAGGYFRSNYLFGPGIDEPLARVDSTEVTYYSVDGLGSVILLTDGSGTVKNKYSYGSWGERQTAIESLVQPFLYTSRESLLLDAPVFENLYYYRARSMMPGIGRFISEDPLGLAAGMNLYRYADGNPVNYSDPFGLITPVRPSRQKWRLCNAAEQQRCQASCKYGMESCMVSQTFRATLTRGKKVYSWVDGPPSCSCKEPSCWQKLKDWATDPRQWFDSDPGVPLPPFVPIPPFALPTPEPVIPGLLPIFSPCMLNPSLCDNGFPGSA
jgi:RHS repeat-associated protein